LASTPQPAARPNRDSRWHAGSRALLLCVLCAGCADDVPSGSYGIDRVRVEGAERIGERAVKACLASKPRPSFGFVLLGREPSTCGVPPYEDSGTQVDMWRWGWTEWPLYDETVFERDRERVERFYRARGYYDARVESVDQERDDDERTIGLTLHVDEGAATHVRSMRVTGLSQLPDATRRSIEAAVDIRRGDRFDEHAYDEARFALERALGNASYAKARVTGKVALDPKSHTADILLHVSPGKPCRFGIVTVEGNEDLPALPVRSATSLRQGQPFSLDALDDARQAVYALGAFASVEMATDVDNRRDVVNVVVRVVPGRRLRFGIGAGIESGGPQSRSLLAGSSFAQWDVHLLARVEHRNFLGGMRRIRVEERPRLIFDDAFPSTSDPNLGNWLSVNFDQPAFIEARTTLTSSARWDLGPDPYGGQFYRSDLVIGLGPERHFFGGKLLASSTVNTNLFNEIESIEAGPYPDYQVFFFEHTVQLELRDDPRRPRNGGYAAATVQHAGYFLPGKWDYVRLTPEVRGYVGLPLHTVLAARAKMGLLFMSGSRIDVAPDDDANGGFVGRLARLGPLRQRLRGGGANSVRGYEPNTLGDAVLVGGRLDSGGLRNWESSVELRTSLTESFGAVLFADVGDVTRSTRFRFDHLQTTLGIGLRYHTLVGPLRLDMGFTPPGLQVIGDDTRVRDGLRQSTLFGANGSLQLTVGEAF